MTMPDSTHKRPNMAVIAAAQAAKAVVEAYKQLRAEDVAPGAPVAYRITVRQLEALIRLSEALARAACRETILLADVKEVMHLHHIDNPGRTFSSAKPSATRLWRANCYGHA